MRCDCTTLIAKNRGNAIWRTEVLRYAITELCLRSAEEVLLSRLDARDVCERRARVRSVRCRCAPPGRPGITHTVTHQGVNE